ncbi:MAG: hypothetical protein KF729_21120 [Sandaracinaceae bacterium]|nr:hypothetical protein [Sandaracinaceae bacterium]
MRSVALALAAVLAPGCYLSHRLPGDGGVEPDAPCEAPPRGPVTLEITIEGARPDGCARVGHVYRVEADLSGDGPVFGDCPDSRAVPTPDACGVRVEARCLGVEYLREVSGTLRGADARGRVDAFMRVGYASAECTRVERWRALDAP